LINYFKRYSSLGDDRFFVSPSNIRLRSEPNNCWDETF